MYPSSLFKEHISILIIISMIALPPTHLYYFVPQISSWYRIAYKNASCRTSIDVSVIQARNISWCSDEPVLPHRVLPPLREALLLDYAELLASHSSLWQVSLLYLDYCGPRGVAMAQEVLQRLPITSDARAQKIIQMASEREFDGVGK